MVRSGFVLCGFLYKKNYFLRWSRLENISRPVPKMMWLLDPYTSEAVCNLIRHYILVYTSFSKGLMFILRRYLVKYIVFISKINNNVLSQCISFSLLFYKCMLLSSEPALVFVLCVQTTCKTTRRCATPRYRAPFFQAFRHIAASL